MAVSSLSRQVLLKALAPRLTAQKIRVFVMGFPGNQVRSLLPIIFSDLLIIRSFGRFFMLAVSN
jgi:hypothetical protein